MSDHRALLERLTLLQKDLAVRAEYLPADLALGGLVEDVLDASTVAIQLPEDRTRVIYPLVRTVFEAVQRVIVLATDDDYLRIGTRAWLYYQYKDSSVIRKTDPDRADRWLEATTSRMRQIWKPYNKRAGELLDEAARTLEEHQKKRRTDNFMGADFAEVVQERYARIPGLSGVPADLKMMNRGIYASLSRESHARLRIEVAALTVQPNGVVRMIPRRLNEAAKRQTAFRCLETALTEAVAALSSFLSARAAADAGEVPHHSRGGAANDLVPGFAQDLGTQLASLGGRGTTFHFMKVSARKVGVLPDGTISWSTNVVFGNTEYIATFDVPASRRAEFAQALGLAAELLRPGRGVIKHELNASDAVNVECVLGEAQQSEKETFIPLVLMGVSAAGV